MHSCSEESFLLSCTLLGWTYHNSRDATTTLQENELDTSIILSGIDEQIAKLQKVRALLSEATAVAKRRGRPAGSKNANTVASPAEKKPKGKRNLSPEGRKRIADAMKKRWAERKQAA